MANSPILLVAIDLHIFYAIFLDYRKRYTHFLHLIPQSITHNTMKTWLVIALGAIAFKIIRTKFFNKSTKPNITWIGWILNTILWPLFFLKPHAMFKPLNLQTLKLKAMEQSQLRDFGDFDEQPYQETIDVVNEYNYTPLGRLLLHKFFVD